jgi:hypothetical protein
MEVPVVSTPTIQQFDEDPHAKALSPELIPGRVTVDHVVPFHFRSTPAVLPDGPCPTAHHAADAV